MGKNGHTHPLLSPSASAAWTDVELFAGAGGMTLGFTQAGNAPSHLVEIDKVCCSTLRYNAKVEPPFITGTLHPCDVAKIDWNLIPEPVRVLSGGPPCQPFSMAGKHLAEHDDRNEFPSTLAAIRRLRPAVILLENVHGLHRESFRPYLEYVLRQMECPDVGPRPEELWNEHDARILKRQKDRGYHPAYHVTHRLVNAADYGVPQMRSRLIIMATRADLSEPEIPPPTHSMAALIRDQKTGVYWDRMEVSRPDTRAYPNGPPGYAKDDKVERLPWVTARERLRALPEPTAVDVLGINHWLIPGARLYRGHRGSTLDWPSKTIKAGVHGVAGGENIIHLDDGGFRYFTLREMAILQGFPKDYVFQGPRSRIIGQIGNAVPCELARVLAMAMRPVLNQYEERAVLISNREAVGGGGREWPG